MLNVFYIQRVCVLRGVLPYHEVPQGYVIGPFLRLLSLKQTCKQTCVNEEQLLEGAGRVNGNVWEAGLYGNKLHDILRALCMHSVRAVLKRA